MACNHRIEHELVVEAVEPSPGHWTHHFVIKKESDLNEEVRARLREAFGLHG
ncbi:MAG: hypothetical protein JXA49_04275 [Actinobacteria bacterium]|nr:hypothetical protein [Actinomycetota bacterium]